MVDLDEFLGAASTRVDTKNSFRGEQCTFDQSYCDYIAERMKKE